MPRVLITGACGFVGPSLVNLGLLLGHEVYATDLKPTYQSYLNPKAKLQLGLDITKKEAVVEYIRALKPDVILHAAAYFRYFGPWSLYETININGTQNILEGALKVPNIQKVILWSSGSVLGHTFKNSGFLGEEAPADPRSYYEKSKLIGEQKGLEYKDRLPLTVIRPAAIYGSGIDYGGPAGTYGALKIIQMMFKNQLHAVPGNGKNRFTFIHVEDIARVAYFLADCKEAAGQVYNVADRSQHNLSELMIYIAKWIRSRNIPLNFTPKLHFPIPVIYLLGLWCESLAKIQKREPAVERPFLNFFRPGYHFLMSNEKLDRLLQKWEGKIDPRLGPVIKYRDIILGGAFDKNMEWYRRNLLCC